MLTQCTLYRQRIAIAVYSPIYSDASFSYTSFTIRLRRCGPVRLEAHRKATIQNAQTHQTKNLPLTRDVFSLVPAGDSLVPANIFDTLDAARVV